MNRRRLLLAAAFLGASLASASTAMALPDDGEGELYSINASDAGRVPRQFRRQEVSYPGPEKPGTIVIDTANRHLYLVQPGGEAIRYGIGVGRQGFSWSGRANVRWKAKWPKWTPPAEMVARDPLAARWADGMPGGPTNPLGARALYLFQGKVDTLYRIHGTNDPRSIGKAVSSGCIRLLNVDVADLYERVPPGTPVVVLQGRRAPTSDRLMVNREVEKPVKPEKPAKPEKSAQVKRNFNLN